MNDIEILPAKWLTRLMGRDSKGSSAYRTSKELSMLLGLGDFTLLFDTCWSENEFRHNFSLALKQFPSPDVLAISHLHADHVRGIPYVHKKYPGIPVYVPELKSVVDTVRHYHPGFDPAKVDFRILTKPVTSVRPELKLLRLCIPDDICELYPAVRTRHGWIVLTGCGHMRENIVARTTELLGEQPYALMGGIHSWGYPRQDTIDLVRQLKKTGLQKVGAFHCCGEIFRREALKKFGRDRMFDYQSLPMGHVQDLDSMVCKDAYSCVGP